MDSLSSGSMWSRACAVIDEAERRHRRFFELLVVSARHPAWEPPVDIFVLEHELHVRVALPGVRADQIEMELSPGGLRVRAESHLPRFTHQARIVRLEIPYGRIERHIELPPGRYELLGHDYVDGCVHIRLGGEWP